MKPAWAAAPVGGLVPLATEFGERIDPDALLQEYPRPQLQRDSYVNLNGWWDYAITDSARHPRQMDGRILVPFSPEAPLSGVGRQLRAGQFLHYRRAFAAPEHPAGWRVLAQFGAVDERCAVFVNGHLVGRHRGGYLPFEVDITDAVQEGVNELRVVVRDDTDRGDAARGKQATRRGGIWYTPFSGIWQTVWLEVVPPQRIQRLEIAPRLESATLEITVHAASAAGPCAPGTMPQCRVVVSDGEEQVTATGPAGEPIAIELSAPHMWTPLDPHLYDVAITMGEDSVRSYAAMRSVSLGLDGDGIQRLELNGEPYFHAGLLDQGYWPDGIATPPSDEAMVFDIDVAKRLGFTMLRKHIKIEPMRWYYHCDRLGMLVWQDLVNGGDRYRPLVVTAPVIGRFHLPDRWHRAFARASMPGRARWAHEATRTIQLLQASPSIVCWVAFNEGWGQFDALRAERAIRALDPTRLIDHASGWHDQGGGDLISRHVYFTPIVAPRRSRVKRRAFALSEYGGYAWRVAGHVASPRVFGYRRYASGEELTDALCALHEQLARLVARGLSASVYTQLSDVEDEVNGLVTYDRRVVKVDEDRVREAIGRMRSALNSRRR